MGSLTTLTTMGGGFEPSIVVAPDGTLYATAAKTARPGPGTRMASWLWFSQDGGETWRDLPSPAQVHEAMLGFEGDIATDESGHLYFADIYVADTTLSRWSPGPTWDWSRPLTGLPTPVDDRPWVAAHGSGIVYLMLNTGENVPTPETLLAGDTRGAARWIFRSEDAGVTWSLGHGVPLQDRCDLEASRADDQSILVVCQSGEGDASLLTVFQSPDRARTLTPVQSVPFQRGSVFMDPGAAIDAAGQPYAAWLDDLVVTVGFQDEEWQGDEPGRVLYAYQNGTAWTERDVTPFPARFANMDASAGAAGTLALTFYATTDLTPGADTEWVPYLMVSSNAADVNATWAVTPLLEEPAGVGKAPPEDFFQNAVGPDNRVHVILQKDRPEDLLRDGTVVNGVPADVLHAGQVSGPNLPAPDSKD